MYGLSYRKSRRRRKYKFSPPRHVPWALWLARRVAPVYLRSVLKVTRVDIADDDAARLEALRGQRVLLTPNHPTEDPVVMFQLSTRVRMNYFWLAARELFENPLQNFMVSRVGAYSVDRGARDTDAINTTRSLISGGEGFVVLFPEGMNHFLHDIVMPFLPGAARLSFGALDDLSKGGTDPPPVYCVPIALRYYYIKNMGAEITRSLIRLEQYLGLEKRAAGLSWKQRLDLIVDCALDANEEFYGVTPDEDDTPPLRLDRLRELVIRRVAESLGVDVPPSDKPQRNRARQLLSMINRLVNTAQLPEGEYAQQLAERRRARAQKLKGELNRVIEMVAITEDILATDPTVENYLDILGRVEREVFGKQIFRGPRAVQVKVGNPVDLREYYCAYRENADEGSELVAQLLEDRVRELLNTTSHLMTPLPG